jgi:GNAT superfamily N-acetyltransferase
MKQPCLSVRIRTVSNADPALLDAVLRLRHRVLREETGGAQITDSNGLFTDNHDLRDDAVILAALNDVGELVGTMRLTARRNFPFIADGEYRFDLLAAIVGYCHTNLREKTGLVDRVCVDPRFRRQGVFNALFENAINLARTFGLKILVVAIKDQVTPISMDVFERKSFKIYSSSSFEGTLFHHLFLALDTDACSVLESRPG